MIKAIFFDFDGVLTKHESGSHTTMLNLAYELGIEYEVLEKEYIKNKEKIRSGKLSISKIIKDLCIEREITFNPEIINNAYIKIPINEEMLELVNLLSKNYKVGIITDNSKERFDAIDKEYRFSNTFDFITISEEVGSGKTKPDIFKLALKKSNINPDEAIFIDNKKENLIIPNRMGFEVIHHHHNDDIDKFKLKLKSCGVIT